MKLVDTLIAALRRKLLGISPEEIRYTFEDVRARRAAVAPGSRERTGDPGRRGVAG
jgi:hypothetical protein